MKPVTPEQVKKNFVLPDHAISVINNIITKHFTGTESIFNKSELEEALWNQGFSKNTIDSIIERIPKLYTQYGWGIQVTKNGFIFQELLN